MDLEESLLVRLYGCDASGKELTASSDTGKVMVDDAIDITDHVLQPSRLWVAKISFAYNHCCTILADSSIAASCCTIL